MIRLYNARLLTMDGGVNVTEGEVWTRDSTIAYVGPTPAELPDFERQIDLRGDLLMPGLKNAHAHSAMTFLRNRADDLPLQEWLFGRVIPLEGKLNPDYIRIFTRLAILEYLAGGTTACFDMYYHRQAFAEACRELGFRAVICCGIDAGEESWPGLDRDYEQFNRFDPLISCQLGFHAEYTGSVPMLDYIADAARRYHAPVFSHNSETRSEVAGCIERHGMTPTALFESRGVFAYGGGGFHCTYMTDEDIDIFVRRGLWAVSNPAANLKLASGIAPLTRMKQAGVNLALGTDGAAGNNALDLFREMFLAAALQKVAEDDASAFPAASVLEMAAVGSARAMGLSQCDAIAVGKQADLIVVDLHKPNMRPQSSIPAALVYSCSSANVRMTMIAGRILYENGEYHIGADPEQIYAEAEQAAKEIAG